MTAFVLVHGAGFSASCWDPMIPLLRPPVLAVDLPGRGSRPADPGTVTVADFVAAVADDIVDSGLTDVVLVGHSLAGITLPGVAARVPDRLARLVFVACAVPAHGQRIIDVLDTFSPAAAEVVSLLGSDAVTSDGALHPRLATAMFCNDMDDALTAFTLARLVPESAGVLGEPVDLSGLDQRIPRTYVRLERDASLVPAEQDAMIANLGGAEVLTLDAGHMAMISRPGELADLLNAL